jgi:hypothetical protein
MRTRMLMVAVALLLVAGCGSNSPIGPSVSAPERAALDEGGAIGSGNATDPPPSAEKSGGWMGSGH